MRYLITTTYNIPNSSSGSTQLRSAPLGFEYTGTYGYGTGLLDGIGLVGYYWSRLVDSATHARNLFLHSDYGIALRNSSTRGAGFAVRCEAKSLNFLRTGVYYRSNGGIDLRSILGQYWSGTSRSATNTHFLNTEPSYIRPQHLNYRGAGFAIRCVVREG